MRPLLISGVRRCGTPHGTTGHLIGEPGAHMRSVDPTSGPAFRLREIRRVHACAGRSRLVERSNGSGAVRTRVVRIHSKLKLRWYKRTGRSLHRTAIQKGRKSAALSIGDAPTSVEAVPYTHRD